MKRNHKLTDPLGNSDMKQSKIIIKRKLTHIVIKHIIIKWHINEKIIKTVDNLKHDVKAGRL